MSQVRHIEIIEAETDADGNFLKSIDEEDNEEVGEIIFIEADEYEFITQDSNELEQPGALLTFLTIIIIFYYFSIKKNIFFVSILNFR